MTIPGETLATGANPVCQDCNVTLKLEVLMSNAGFYIGTQCDCGPCTRESGYYRTRELAEKDLKNATYYRP